MRAFVLLLLVGLATAQFTNHFRVPTRNNRNFQPQRNFQPRRNFAQPPSQRLNSAVDERFGNSEYHYSWNHAGRNTKWTHGGAVQYCRSVGFDPISIDSPGENEMVINAIRGSNTHYIWTSGRRSGNGFTWGNGVPVPGPSRGNPFPWSHTGALRKNQPDNRERGGENCLAILNNVYQDGITWHDVGCSHQKPIICERSLNRG